MITNDAIVLGILLAILALVFKTSSLEARGWRRFYTFVPPIFLCYFLPSLLTSSGVISPDASSLYPVARDYLLPTSLVLLTLSIDLGGVVRLGPKAVILFLAATASVVLGGPIAALIVQALRPEWLVVEGGGSVAGGMATVAGSWIGGGANQAAMKEVFEVEDGIYGVFVAVDVIVANLWTACLLVMAGKSTAIDRWLGADTSAIDDLRTRVSDYQRDLLRVPRTADTMLVLAVGFGATAVAHLVGDSVAPRLAELSKSTPWLARLSLTEPFFWIVVVATIAGLGLSTTRLRALEGVGASRVGTVLLYVLVVTIGMKMDLRRVVENPQLFALGGIWMLFHAAVMLLVCKLLRAPVFFLAVGSQANIGGAASAPIVASAFHPSLATVGVLLAVLGYALGTFGAWLCGLMLQQIVP